GGTAEHAGPPGPAEAPRARRRPGNPGRPLMNRFLPDPFIPAVLLTLLIATLWPASGEAATLVSQLATAAVMLLFFLHGVKLPRENLIAALTHWRLHLLILGSTYLLFPLLGL